LCLASKLKKVRTQAGEVGGWLLDNHVCSILRGIRLCGIRPTLSKSHTFDGNRRSVGESRYVENETASVPFMPTYGVNQGMSQRAGASSSNRGTGL
jgi:hypothetical protein